MPLLCSRPSNGLWWCCAPWPGCGTGPLVAPPAPAEPGAPTDFDLLQRWLNLTELSGFHLVDYTTSRYWQVAELAPPAGDRTVTITLYATGGDPTYRTSNAAPTPLDPAAGEPTDPGGGAQTYQPPAQHFG